MKYKDIYNFYDDEDLKIKMPIRVSYCSPEIRKKIDDWLRNGIEPELEVCLHPTEEPENTMNLSVNILTQDYGFNVLDALLFLDWTSQSDKDLYKALYALRHHPGERRMEPIELSPSALSPGVKAAYEKLVAKQQTKLEQLRKVYESIKDNDIYEG